MSDQECVCECPDAPHECGFHDASDAETVPVPREKLMALADEWERDAKIYKREGERDAAGALQQCARQVRALARNWPAEPSEADRRALAEAAPADPVSEAHCRCGHTKAEHHFGLVIACSIETCPCIAFTPAPPPTTPRDELAEAQTPRVARSLDDLRVGQVIVVDAHGVWKVGTIRAVGNGGASVQLQGDSVRSQSAFGFGIGQWFILSDPPAGAATPPTTAERIADVLRANGLVEHPTSPEEVEQDIHSWRCGYPDHYDPCDCFAELVSDLAALFDAGERGEP